MARTNRRRKHVTGNMTDSFLAVGIIVIVVVMISVGIYFDSSRSTVVTTTPSTSIQQASTTINSNQGVTRKSAYDNVVCTTTSPQFNCTPADHSITHLVNYINSTSTRTFRGTLARVYLGQNKGANWFNARVVFVPSGTAYSNGIPSVNFSSMNGSALIGFIPNETTGLAVFVPVSLNLNGTFTGQLWVRYVLINDPTPRYVNIGNFTVSTSS